MAPSAMNIGETTNEAFREETFTTQRPNPVALEVPVTITGARVSERAEGRNLFSEETKTVLVFRDGAVIHLAAGVAAGQLLFLTNKNNNREEVCQVIRKRIYKPTSCFVELEFTEAAEDFWGVEFPKETGKSGLPKAAEDAVDAEITEETSAAGVEQGPEEVERLREEVKKLREQLNVLVKGPGSTSAEAATADRPAAKVELAHVNDQSPVAPAVPEKITAVTQVPAVTEEASKEGVQSRQDAGLTPATPASDATEKKDERRPVVRMTLPNQMVESATPIDPSEDLLPKPGLDFSKIPAWAPHPGESDPNSIYKRVRGKAEKIRLAVVGILLAAIVVGGGWYGARKILPGGKKAEVTAPDSAEAATAGKPGTSAGGAPGPNEVGTANVKTTNDPVAEATKAIQARLEAREKQKAAAAKAIPAANAEIAPSNGGAVPDSSSETIQIPQIESQGKQKAAATRSNAGTNAALKKSLPNAARTSAVVAPGQAVIPAGAGSESNNDPIVPAKLIKQVEPVYPPNAMTNYIAGDVRAEVVVETSGRVGTVKVLSGPGQFRDPAVDALKEYRFEPARQGGRLVASKVVVTVKFWFIP